MPLNFIQSCQKRHLQRHGPLLADASMDGNYWGLAMTANTLAQPPTRSKVVESMGCH